MVVLGPYGPMHIIIPGPIRLSILDIKLIICNIGEDRAHVHVYIISQILINLKAPVGSNRLRLGSLQIPQNFERGGGWSNVTFVFKIP